MSCVLRSVAEIETDRSVCNDSVSWARLTHILHWSWWWAFNLNMQSYQVCHLLSGNVRVFLGMKAPWWCRLHYWKYRGADKSLVRPGRKQTWKHVRTRTISTKLRHELSSSFFSCKARRRRKFKSFWQKHKLVSFLVGLRTYQHLCKDLCFEDWSSKDLQSVTNIADIYIVLP